MSLRKPIRNTRGNIHTRRYAVVGLLVYVVAASMILVFVTSTVFSKQTMASGPDTRNDSLPLAREPQPGGDAPTTTTEKSPPEINPWTIGLIGGIGIGIVIALSLFIVERK